ncbi:TPA: hypothetical protein ACXDAZ_002663 [Clostridium botulinum]
MEQKCFNCKYYWDGECNNKDFKKMVAGNSIKDDFISIIESGCLSEYSKEQKKKVYELADMALKNLTDLEYIKKSKKKIKTYEDIDKYKLFLINFIEISDEIISDYIVPKLKNTEPSYYVDSEFGCKFWE